MTYLYWYLGIGVATLAAFLGEHLFSQRRESKGPPARIDAADPNRGKLSDRVVDYLIAVLATVVIVAGWPVAICMAVVWLFERKSDSATTSELPFAVERKHLQERLTLPQIEDREMVLDPLGAVPELPFGHLNPAWRGFAERIEADDEVWSFIAPWHSIWTGDEIRAGYVVVRGGVPAAYFLTLMKAVDQESSDPQDLAVQGVLPSKAP